jgi:peptide/nickel transport system permease protein
MTRYLVTRISSAFVTLLGITLLIFLAMRVLPGDPLAQISTEGQGQYRLSPAELQRARASLGLDQPLYLQYANWLGDIARGDLGRSFWRGEPIRDLILRRAPITAEIASLAIVLSWLIGIPVGSCSAIKHNRRSDLLIRGILTFLTAIPSFWLGLTIVLIGILYFSWRPPLTIIYFWDDWRGNLQIVAGPSIALGLGLAAVTARMTRSSVLEILYEDHVRTARAKGLTERIVVSRHVLRLALLPVVTLSGLAFGGLLGGSVAVERAFGVPGLGLALVQALNERDWMVIQNLVFLYGVIYTSINLLVDVSYAWLDPRIRYG